MQDREKALSVVLLTVSSSNPTDPFLLVSTTPSREQHCAFLPLFSFFRLSRSVSLLTLLTFLTIVVFRVRLSFTVCAPSQDQAEALTTGKTHNFWSACVYELTLLGVKVRWYKQQLYCNSCKLVCLCQARGLCLFPYSIRVQLHQTQGSLSFHPIFFFSHSSPMF